MLDNFKGKGHCVTMDSAYMGDIMALIGSHDWKINMLGAAQENRTGADTAKKKKGMKKNTYEAVMCQHDTEPLCYVIWSDNNLVRILFNFHTPKIVEGGVKRKRRVQGTQERTKSPVACPQKQSIIRRPFISLTRGMTQKLSMI